MAKTNNGGTIELVSEARALAFCAQLNSKNRRALAMCIDRKLVVQSGPFDASTSGRRARQMAKDALRRIEAGAAFLLEEARENASGAIEDDEGELDEAA